MDREMKDSKILWVGDIPQNWNILRIKNTSWLKGRIGWDGLKSEEFQETGPYLITGTDFKNGYVDWDTCVHITEERFAEDELLHIHEGDLLITKDGTIGKLAIAKNCPDKVSLNSGVMIIRNNSNWKYNEKYMYYVLSSNVFSQWFESEQKPGSTIKHLYQHQFEEFQFPLPPLNEQCSIVTYLDAKCAAIDEAIERHQKIIEKLEEYWKSVVWSEINSHVDTTGKLKILFELHRGYDLTANSFVNGSVPVYGSGGFVGYHNEAKCVGPNVVIGRSGSTGKLTYVPDAVFWAHNTGIYVSDFRGNIPKYVYYLLLTIDIDSLANKTAVPTLDRKNVQNYVASFTTNTEQQNSIVDKLDVLYVSIQKSKTIHEKSITKLEEYRKSIIYNAVTGKIDCRTEAS